MTTGRAGPRATRASPCATRAGSRWSTSSGRTRASPRTVPLSGSPSFDSPNLFYDLYHARWLRTVGGGSWSPNQRVSDVSSRQDRAVSGGRTSVTANDLVLFALWTDRRLIPTVSDKKQDLYGSRVRPLY